MMTESGKGASPAPLGLYLHIPFCLKKCAYCDFCSYPDRLDKREEYVSAILRRLAEKKPLLPERLVSSVYLGGGTPTLLAPSQLRTLFSGLREAVSIAPDAEITCEVNPRTADRETFSQLLSFGVNRLSIGVQSFSDRELTALGRLHTAAEAEDCVLAAQSAGFQNISLDLMYGIPEETLASFRHSLSRALALGIPHLSLYSLKIEEGTPFAKKRETLALPSEEETEAMLAYAEESLGRAGLWRYEISNYARPGFESRHNLLYWRGEEYLGLGPSAYSYLGGFRFGTGRDLDAFLSRTPLADIDRTEITPEEREEEAILLRLRLGEGISFALYRRLFGRDFPSFFAPVLQRLAPFLRLEDGRVSLNSRGMQVSNSVIVEFLLHLEENRATE